MGETSDNGQAIRPLTAKVLQWFVDRERALRRFSEMLSGRSPALVLMVEGPGGIGKTWLLERLDQEAWENQVPASRIDFASPAAFDDLLMVHRTALALGTRHFDTLNDTLAQATELRVVLKIESGAGDGSVVFHGDAHIEGDIAGRDIIKNNTFNLSADNPQTRKIWQENINQAFFADLARLASSSGVVLGFDSLERATNEAWSWIEDQLLRRIGDGQLLGARVVIAGEQTPRLPSAWHDLVAKLGLDPLPAAEVRKYLQDKRQLVISEENVALIYEITEGRPDLVALIAESNPKEIPEQPDADRLLEILIEGILESAEAPVPETLRVAAVAEWFDAALLTDLLGTTSGVDDRIAALQAYTFVQDDERGYLRFAPAVRRVLLAKWERQPTEYRELHRRAASHFDGRALRAADPRVREELERQAMGHCLVIDELAGRDRLRDLFERSEEGYRLAACELLLERAEAVADLADLTRAWLCYLQGRLALARNDYSGSAELFGSLLEQTDPGSELYALVDWGLGQVAAERGEWAEAIERYERSLRYFHGQGDRAQKGQVMLALGDVHLEQARALGGLIRPQLVRRGGWRRFVEAIPAFLVALPFVIYAWAIRRWRFLPPLHHGMNYRNWTLARLLLTAVGWYRDAEDVFDEIEQGACLADTRQRLAQVYHRLGWWRAAGDLFVQVLDSGPVVTNAYRQAQVRKEYADTELVAGNTDKAIAQLEESFGVFERFQDVQAQAQVQALLGQAWMEKGQFERGLALFRESLHVFSTIEDRLGIGLALHALRRWVDRANPVPEQATDVQSLIATVSEKTYLPRVQDRLAALLEFGISISLLLLVATLLVRLGANIAVSTVSELYAYLLSVETAFRLVGGALLLIWAYVFGSGLIGLFLIKLGERREPEPQSLDTIVTSTDAVIRYDYRGQETTKIPWNEIQANVSKDCIIWRTPIALLSEYWLFDGDAPIRVPATVLWYSAIKRDIEDHLERSNAQPTRLKLDVRVLRSWIGLSFLLGPIFLGLGSELIWNKMALPVSTELAAIVGPMFLVLGLIGLMAGPYWWLVLHPLWVRYVFTPRSRMPIIAGGLGLIIVVFALYLRYAQPFFPIRHWLDETVHPIGFILIIIAPLWILTAREWTHSPVVRGRSAYKPWMRVIAGILLVGALLLTGHWAQEVLSYVHVARFVTYFRRGDDKATIVGARRALTISDTFADAYYYRARSHYRLGNYRLAVEDLNRLIDSGEVLTIYYLYRARAYEALGDYQAACGDLRAVFDARRWRLSKVGMDAAQDLWQDLECDSPESSSGSGWDSVSQVATQFDYTFPEYVGGCQAGNLSK